MKHHADIFHGELVALDLGVADVHTPGSDDNAPRWIQIAKPGTFRGHPAGPFTLDRGVFQELITNFRATENQRIPWDFEHASEQDSTQGSIPVTGAPAQGWITDLRIGDDGNLYGLTSWGDLARQYVREQKYRYCSPAIRFGSKDRVSGRDVGARLTSVALTNEPFLDGMAPLAAKDAATEPGPTLSAHVQMLRACLKDHACKEPACMTMHTLSAAVCSFYSDDGSDSDEVSMRLRDLEGREAEATFKLRDAEAKLSQQATELETLRTDKATRDEADLVELVDRAFATHEHQKNLGPDDRPRMMAFARADKAKFREMFQPAPPHLLGLLRRATPPEPRPAPPPRMTREERATELLNSGECDSWLQALETAGAQG